MSCGSIQCLRCHVLVDDLLEHKDFNQLKDRNKNRKSPRSRSFYFEGKKLQFQWRVWVCSKDLGRRVQAVIYFFVVVFILFLFFSFINDTWRRGGAGESRTTEHLRLLSPRTAEGFVGVGWFCFIRIRSAGGRTAAESEAPPSECGGWRMGCVLNVTGNVCVFEDFIVQILHAKQTILKLLWDGHVLPFWDKVWNLAIFPFAYKIWNINHFVWAIFMKFPTHVAGISLQPQLNLHWPLTSGRGRCLEFSKQISS